MFLYTAAMAVELARALSRTELSGGGQALAAVRQENAALRQALERAVHKAEKFRRDAETWRDVAEKWRGAFHRALVRVLKKGREAPLRDPETAENERLKSHNRKFVRKLFGRSSERRPMAPCRSRQ